MPTISIPRPYRYPREFPNISRKKTQNQQELKCLLAKLLEISKKYTIQEVHALSYVNVAFPALHPHHPSINPSVIAKCGEVLPTPLQLLGIRILASTILFKHDI